MHLVLFRQAQAEAADGAQKRDTNREADDPGKGDFPTIQEDVKDHLVDKNQNHNDAAEQR